jgi:hypothetical protein
MVIGLGLMSNRLNDGEQLLPGYLEEGDRTAPAAGITNPQVIQIARSPMGKRTSRKILEREKRSSNSFSAHWPNTEKPPGTQNYPSHLKSLSSNIKDHEEIQHG